MSKKSDVISAARRSSERLYGYRSPLYIRGYVKGATRMRSLLSALGIAADSPQPKARTRSGKPGRSKAKATPKKKKP